MVATSTNQQSKLTMFELMAPYMWGDNYLSVEPVVWAARFQRHFPAQYAESEKVNSSGFWINKFEAAYKAEYLHMSEEQAFFFTLVKEANADLLKQMLLEDGGLQMGIDPNKYNNDAEQNTALHLAVLRHDLDTIRVLYTNFPSLNPHMYNGNDQTPFDLAKEGGNDSIIKVIRGLAGLRAHLPAISPPPRLPSTLPPSLPRSGPPPLPRTAPPPLPTGPSPANKG